MLDEIIQGILRSCAQNRPARPKGHLLKNWRRKLKQPLRFEPLEDRRPLASRVLDFNGLSGNTSVGSTVNEDGFQVQSLNSVNGFFTRGSGYPFSSAQGITLFQNSPGGDTRVLRADGGNFRFVDIQLNSLNNFAASTVPFTANLSAGGTQTFSLTTDANYSAFQTFASSISAPLTSLVWDQTNSGGDYHQFDNITLEIGPSITSIAQVSPDPRMVPVSGIDMTFNEAIDLSSFTFADLTLTRDGNAVSLNSGVTITHSTGTTYTINGLGAFTALNGSYQLTVNALNILSPTGLQGTGSANESWVMDLPPTITSTSFTSSGTLSANATSLQITFSEPVSYSLGSSQFPARSATEILQSNPSAPSGVYWIDPDGNGSTPAMQVYCDMTTDGGGWMLAVNSVLGSEPSSNDITSNTGTVGLSTAHTRNLNSYFVGATAEVRHDVDANNLSQGRFHAKYTANSYGVAFPGGSLTELAGHTNTSLLQGSINAPFTSTPFGANWFYTGAPTVVPATPSAGSTAGPYHTASGQAASSYRIWLRSNAPITSRTDATSPSHYQLRRAGADGLLGNGDDGIISISGVSISGTTATLSFAGLPEDIYRLTVLSTITDGNGNALDGDGNGVAGGDWRGDFVVNSAPATLPYRFAEFSSYDQNYGWMMGNNASMFGGVAPSTWGDGNGIASQMSTNPATLATLFPNKGYAGANAMLQAETWSYYSSTNSKHYAALFQVQNSTGSAITWSPSFYYTAYGNWNEYASVAINGNSVWTSSNSNSGSSTTQSLNISIPANSTANVIFVSASDAPSGTTRTNALGFYNNSLSLPSGLTFVDQLPATSPYRFAEFSSYDQNYGWMMGNNASMFGGVAPSTWGDGNGIASQMSTNPATLATLFPNKGYAGANAMLQAETWGYYSSTNSKHYAALFQVQNSTGGPITWTPSFYYTSYSGWGEVASVAVNGSLVWQGSTAGSNATQTLSISIPANSTANVIFVSASDAPSGTTRTNALGFYNNSLSLPSGLTFVDQLPATSPLRFAEFSSYDQNYGWMMGNNASMFGGVAPSTWGDGNGIASQMSTSLSTLATLFPYKAYVGANAMLQAETWAHFSSTNSKHYAALLQIQNTTGSAITWSPYFYYTSYGSWNEYASMAVNGLNVWSSSNSGNGSSTTQSISISIPANSISNFIIVSASDAPNGTRTNALGFYNNSLSLPAGLTFIDQLSESPTSTSRTSSNGLAFDIDSANFATGALVHGSSNAFDGLNRLLVNGANYAPAAGAIVFADNERTLITPAQTMAGLAVSREITVPNAGSQDFARTVDVFTNPTGSPITTTVKILGNLGSDAATTVFSTSDGDNSVEVTDSWIGTDDADGSGTPAIIHYIHGPLGLQPTSVQVLGDNIVWEYSLTVAAGQTVRLANFTILDTSRAGAMADAAALVTTSGFTGQAGAFLTGGELASLANFQFNQAPSVNADSSEVSSLEGDLLSNTGTFSDAQGNATVTISASVGDVTQDDLDGTWIWSLDAEDGDAGPVTVTITATDDFGVVTETTFTYSIDDVPPTISLAGNASANEGAVYTLDLLDIVDPGQDTITGYKIDWGDGAVDSFSGDPTNTTATHTYANGPGSLQPSVYVTNEDGVDFLAGSISLEVENVAPTADFGNDGPFVYGETVTVSFSNQSDDSSEDATAGFRYAYSTTGDFTGVTYASGSVVDASQAYSGLNAGSYTFYARIIDQDDGFSEYTTTVTVDKAATSTVVTINGGPFVYDKIAKTPATVEVMGPGGVLLNPAANYANNVNAGTATASYTFAGDANHYGSSDSENFTIAQNTVTTLVNGVVGGQRSQITSLKLTFAAPLSLTLADLVLTNFDGFASPVNVGTMILTQVDATNYTITFGAGASVITRGAAGGGNSLADGNYKLTMAANGNYQYGAAYADKFFRLFGDGDGDGDVDGTDTLAFRRALSIYNAAFDWNGNGSVTNNSPDSTNFAANNSKKRKVF